MRVIHYIRVSTDEQATKGHSLDSQLRRLDEDSKSQDHEVVYVAVDEGKSAKNMRRPELQIALRMLREGKADAIKVVKLDRLTRSVEDWSRFTREYLEKGKQVLSLSEQIDISTAAGWFACLMFIGLAEMERRQTSERVIDQGNERKQSGLRYCRSVYGMKAVAFLNNGKEDHRLEPCPEEQSVIRKMQEWCLHGWTYGSIAEELNSTGVRPPRGSMWHPMTIKRILDRTKESYAV